MASETLARVSAALRLDPAESEYLVKLVHAMGNGSRDWTRTVTERVRALVESYSVGYAFVTDPCWDVLVSNDRFTNLFELDHAAAELERHMADIERLGVEWVVFTGGEPLMHSDLFRLSVVLRARGIRTTILSTGLLLEANSARIAEGTDEVIVSLDGPREIHDGIRRVFGAFDLLQEGIRALRKIRSDIQITARSTVQKANYAHLMETV